MAFIKSEHDPLINLIRIAQEDMEIHQQLSFILSLETFHRKSAINSLLENMSRNQAPEEIITAISYLLDEENVEKIRLLIH